MCCWMYGASGTGRKAGSFFSLDTHERAAISRKNEDLQTEKSMIASGRWQPLAVWLIMMVSLDAHAWQDLLRKVQ